MKVLLINGSPHGRGCTFMALSEVAGALKENEVDAEIIQVGHKDIRGCTACGRCAETGRCVFDDIVNETAPLFAESDGLVLGSPVHFASAAGGLLSFLDRLFYSAHFDKTMKAGAAVVAARRGGCTAAFDTLNKYFTISGMPVVSSRYWNMLYGAAPEEARRDTEGLETMRVLGRNMAFLIKSIALGKERYGLPGGPGK